VLKADPPAGLLDTTNQGIMQRLETWGITGEATATQSGLFTVEMRDVFDLQRAMVLLAELPSAGLPVPVELIDVRSERIETLGER